MKLYQLVISSPYSWLDYNKRASLVDRLYGRLLTKKKDWGVLESSNRKWILGRLESSVCGSLGTVSTRRLVDAYAYKNGQLSELDFELTSNKYDITHKLDAHFVLKDIVDLGIAVQIKVSTGGQYGLKVIEESDTEKFILAGVKFDTRYQRAMLNGASIMSRERNQRHIPVVLVYLHI
jgi:hypothetical protein